MWKKKILYIKKKYNIWITHSLNFDNLKIFMEIELIFQSKETIYELPSSYWN